MKKKLFLITLMMVALISVFTISAFADEIIVSKTESEELGTIIQLNADPGLDNASQYVSTLKKINDAGTDKDALVILTDGNTDNPSYYVFPSSYIVDERADGKLDLIATPLATAISEFNTAKGTSYYADYSVYGSGATKRINPIVRFEFTSDVTSVSDSLCCFRSYPNLVEVRFNYEINLSGAGDLFKSSSKLKTVVGFENADPSLAKSMFIGCNSLETVSLSTDITRIPNSMFWGCKKVTITNLSECTQLTTIGASAFQDTSYLVFTLPDSVTTIEKSAFQSAFKEGNGGSFTINPTSQLTTIGASAFEDCRKMPKNVYIPSTVTSIGEKAFTKCYTLETLENFENCEITEIKDGTFTSVTNLKTIKIPETVTTIGAAFADNNYLALVYIPKSVTSIADTFTGGKPTNAVFIYTGSDKNVLSTCSKLANANVINASDYDAEKAYTGINLVVGFSHCIAYKNGNHGTIEIGSVDVTSYMQPITVKSICSDCKYNMNDRIIDPLFTCIGYSIPENGRKQITIGYMVNNEAIADYTQTTGKAVKYGVFAVVKDNLKSDEIFAEDGKVAENVVNAELEGKFVGFEFKITGFKDDQTNIKLAMGAYTVTSDKDTTEYSYLQYSLVGDKIGNYYFVSYNDVYNFFESLENA